MAHFTTVDMQTVKIYYTVKKNRIFSEENYDCSEKFDENIAETIMHYLDGEVVDWEIVDSDTNDTELLTNNQYCITIRARVTCSGTCFYDPGRYEGPMEDCYPAEIDDIEYTDGLITGVYSQNMLEEKLPELDQISVEVSEPDQYNFKNIDFNY